jgi:hypothetical protein
MVHPMDTKYTQNTRKMLEGIKVDMVIITVCVFVKRPEIHSK